MTASQQSKSALSSRGPSGVPDESGRLIAVMRIGLSCMALLAFIVDPAVVLGGRQYAWLVLTAFAVYSWILLGLQLGGRAGVPIGLAPWLDVLWGCLLISFSGGTNSIYFSFFVFAVLSGALRGGVWHGRWLALAAVSSFVAVGFATAPTGAAFELDRALMRPMYLVTLGGLILYWASHQTQLRRRLALLREVMILSNPRFGVDESVRNVLRQLKDFYRADAAHLVTVSRDRPSTVVIRSEPAGNGGPTEPASSTLSDLAGVFFCWPEGVAALYRAQGTDGVCDLLEGDRSTRTRPDDRQRQLATMLDAARFVSVPWAFDSDEAGRLLLTSRRRRAFHPSDLPFLQQLLGQLTPVLEKVRLVERLASQAAEEERRRLAGDIHDSVIQPYVGLRLAVAAVREKLQAGSMAAAAHDLDRLADLADAELEHLRQYVHGLREGRVGPEQAVLTSAIHRFAERFSALSGISIELQAQPNLTVNDRLAAEVFQMVSEGLSNIRRHTDATSVIIRLACEEGRMSLQLEDNGSGSRSDYRPRSLDERTQALGGRLRRRAVEGRSVLEIQVPL